jgi:DNA polymerase elongation subunit (family B)
LKILHLDLETAPTQAFVWGMWEQNINASHIIKPGYILSFAAKWNGSDEVLFNSVKRAGKETFLKALHALMSEADVIVTYNGKKFDIPTANREFILLGLKPPATYKQIDLLPVVRKQFKFPHNKLDYVCQALGIGSKKKTAGFDMWIGCMNGDEEAWQMMQEYNVEDVIITERLYNVLLPWINNHPNYGLYNNVADVCPNCGGNHLERRGFSYTGAGKYQRYVCKDCGTWSKAKNAVKNESTMRGA